MILVIDIGNTNLTCGIYYENELKSTFRIASDSNISVDEYLYRIKEHTDNIKIEGCIIASVVDELSNTIKNACDKLFDIDSILLTSNSILNIKIATKNPESVGADRIANAASAYQLYKTAVIVIDLGSATTFDIVSKDGHFNGGIIMPGLKMQLKSLNQNTSKLPELDVKDSVSAIGVDTESCILSGVIRGAACAIEGLIRQCKEELHEEAIVVLTGGYSDFISRYLVKSYDYINPTLTLDGLKFIYEMNKNIVNI